MPSSTVPRIVITAPPSAPSYSALVAKHTRAPHRRSPLRRVVSAPAPQRPPPRASRPAPAPPVAVAVRIRSTDAVVRLRIAQSSTLDELRAQLACPAAAGLALDDDGIERWALRTHFHAFLAQAGRNGEPLRLVLH